MKNLFILFIVLIFISCAGTTQVRVGQQTCINSLDHTHKGEKYSIITVAQESENWEWNVSTYKYDIGDALFETHSIGTKYHLTKEIGWFIIDGGIGLRWTSIDERNKWLANSHWLADASISFGVKKDFEYFRLKCLYSLQHLSIPYRGDRGLNFDQLQFGIEIPF